MRIFSHPNGRTVMVMFTSVYGREDAPRRVLLHTSEIESFYDTTLKGDVKGTTIIGTSGHVYVVEETLDDIMEQLGWDLK